jgi:hypothetical protein
MKLNLTFYHFNEIIKKGYSLDALFLLQLVEQGADIKTLCSDSAKLDLIYQGIYRKGLITIDDKLTLTGKELLRFIESKETGGTKLIRKKNIDNEFEEWWKAYPATDTFIINGKSFAGTRSLRNKKDDCKIKLYKILDEGEYTIKELLEALKFEIHQKVDNSIKTNTNKMSYMQNSLTYLNQRSFEPFIELIKEGYIQKIDTPVLGSTDI